VREIREFGIWNLVSKVVAGILDGDGDGDGGGDISAWEFFPFWFDDFSDLFCLFRTRFDVLRKVMHLWIPPFLFFLVSAQTYILFIYVCLYIAAMCETGEYGDEGKNLDVKDSYDTKGVGYCFMMVADSVRKGSQFLSLYLGSVLLFFERHVQKKFLIRSKQLPSLGSGLFSKR
jgi:hypothetical protein